MCLGGSFALMRPCWCRVSRFSRCVNVCQTRASWNRSASKTENGGFMHWAGMDLGLLLLVSSLRLSLSTGFSLGSGNNQVIRLCLRGLVHELSQLWYVCAEEYRDGRAVAAVTGSDTSSIPSFTCNHISMSTPQPNGGPSNQPLLWHKVLAYPWCMHSPCPTPHRLPLSPRPYPCG